MNLKDEDSPFFKVMIWLSRRIFFILAFHTARISPEIQAAAFSRRGNINVNEKIAVNDMGPRLC